ncbi:aa3-type cytochrome c oxidase subunit IV [Novosphingobium sp. PS1R-30]|uniref:Aa3-type cytochrome c oxidase subunit IV n=1 Tax=Novosphingobium anseongense TaxID=3133436 RepID=A0ABU8RQR5_9SPHN|nr:MAG: aa3-type cytochrome c oxidase subunit IV [Novosphingobium sp.]
MASGNDMKAANETYEGFIGMVKWGSIAVALIVILVVGLIVSHK